MLFVLQYQRRHKSRRISYIIIFLVITISFKNQFRILDSSLICLFSNHQFCFNYSFLQYVCQVIVFMETQEDRRSTKRKVSINCLRVLQRLSGFLFFSIKETKEDKKTRRISYNIIFLVISISFKNQFRIPASIICLLFFVSIIHFFVMSTNPLLKKKPQKIGDLLTSIHCFSSSFCQSYYTFFKSNPSYSYFQLGFH